MKKIGIVFIICVWGMGTTARAGAQTQPHFDGSKAGTGRTAHPTHSNIRSVNVQLKQQMRQLQNDEKSGKLTQAQARIVWEKLKNIRRKELEFFRQNGQKELTADQKTQLNQVLIQTAPSI